MDGKSINLYLDDEVYEVFAYDSEDGIYSVDIDEAPNGLVPIAVKPCNISEECSP